MNNLLIILIITIIIFLITFFIFLLLKIKDSSNLKKYLLEYKNKKFLIISKFDQNKEILLNFFEKIIKNKNKDIDYIDYNDVFALFNDKTLNNNDNLSLNYFLMQERLKTQYLLKVSNLENYKFNQLNLFNDFNKNIFVKKENNIKETDYISLKEINTNNKTKSNKDLFDEYFYNNSSYFLASTRDVRFLEREVFDQFDLYVEINYVKKTLFNREKYFITIYNKTNKFLKEFWNSEQEFKNALKVNVFRKRKYYKNLILYIKK